MRRIGALSMNWDELFVKMAHLVSAKSKDPSTKVGCVIVGEGNAVLAVGFNGFPRGVDETDPARWERPVKYDFVAHAEANCVFNAARHGIKLAGATAYLNWEPTPCVECTKALIQAGIKPKEIATKVGCGESTVRRELRRLAGGDSAKSA